jgi:hypothetical protein
MRDLELSQRNIVFPDTARNEAESWRKLFSGTVRLRTIHIVGMAILSVVLTFALWTLRGILSTVAGLAYVAVLIAAFGLLHWRVRKALEKAQHRPGKSTEH